MKNELSRITVDLPKNLHRELKALSVLTGKSMRILLIEAIPLIKEANECLISNHIPNEETLTSLKNIKDGKNLKEVATIQELFKKAGIKC